VRVDEVALKAKLRQVKISGSKNIQTTFFSITLTLPKASDPAMKFVEIAQDLVKELMTIDDTVVIHPYMSKNRLKKKAISDLDKIPKAPGVWNTYFERMFPLKKGKALRFTQECSWVTTFPRKIWLKVCCGGQCQTTTIFTLKMFKPKKRWTVSGLRTLHRIGSHRPVQTPL
jgi:hypothetical protein